MIATLIGPSEVDLSSRAGRFVVTCTTDQVFWLANLPYDTFGEHAFAVYSQICLTYGSPAIPIDNQRRAEREARRKLPKDRA